MNDNESEMSRSTARRHGSAIDEMANQIATLEDAVGDLAQVCDALLMLVVVQPAKGTSVEGKARQKAAKSLDRVIAEYPLDDDEEE